VLKSGGSIAAHAQRQVQNTKYTSQRDYFHICALVFDDSGIVEMYIIFHNTRAEAALFANARRFQVIFIDTYFTQILHKLNFIKPSIPFNKFFNSLSYISIRFISKVFFKMACISPCACHISRLHWKKIFFSFFS